MAARTRKGTKDEGWSEATRTKIQASMLLLRLQDHVLGKAKMSQTQIRAAEILLKKSLPDLSAVQISGDSDAPIEHRVTWLPPQL